MSALLAVSRAIAKRNLIHYLKNPTLIVPSILFPLVFLMANAGGLSNVQNIPGFDYPPGYTTFQFIFVFLQASAFGGIFSGFAIAGDGESGFSLRLMLAASQRKGIVLGYLISGVIRIHLTYTVITGVALLAGMKIDGSAADLFALYLVGLLVNMTATLWSAGFFLRFPTLQAGPFVQIPVFVALFLAPVFVPLSLLTGWIEAIASVNPATALLEAGRSLAAGTSADLVLAFASGLGLLALLSVFALLGLRKAERGLVD